MRNWTPRGLAFEVQRYIDRHFDERPTGDEMAEHCRLRNGQHLSKVFKRIVGVTPGQYIQAQRMEEAARKLLSGTSIMALTRWLGYADGSTFTYAFRCYFGLAPGRWLRSQGLRMSRDNTRRRIADCCRFMRQGMRQYEAARAAGYNNVSHFHSQFRQVMRCTPRQWLEFTTPVNYQTTPMMPGSATLQVRHFSHLRAS